MAIGSSSEAPRHRGTGLIAAIALLPIFTGALYLNGWAYHEGYLAYFHLPSSMFPLDLQATLVHGVLAWLNTGSTALLWMRHSVVEHWFLLLVSIVVVASVFPLKEFSLEFLKTKRLPKFLVGWHLPAWMKRLLLELMRGIAVVYLAIYIPFAMLSAVLVALLILVAPFQSVGRDIAASDARKGFLESPEVSLTAPDSVQKSFRIMSCGGSFCAVYASGHAAVVPRDSVTWASATTAGTAGSSAE